MYQLTTIKEQKKAKRINILVELNYIHNAIEDNAEQLNCISRKCRYKIFQTYILIIYK